VACRWLSLDGSKYQPEVKGNGRGYDKDGSDDVVDHRRYCYIYRKRSPSKCNGSCLNARDNCLGL